MPYTDRETIEYASKHKLEFITNDLRAVATGILDLMKSGWIILSGDIPAIRYVLGVYVAPHGKERVMIYAFADGDNSHIIHMCNPTQDLFKFSGIEPKLRSELYELELIMLEDGGLHSIAKGAAGNRHCTAPAYLNSIKTQYGGIFECILGSHESSGNRT